jgi:magnesium transporter
VDGLAQTLKDPRTEVVWIDIVRPREGAESLLRDTLGLSPLVVEDCVSPLRMPKLDVFEGGAFLAAFAARLEDGRLRALEVNLVVGPGYLVTVRSREVEELTGGLGGLMDSGKGLDEEPQAMLAHAALDALTDKQLPVIETLSGEIEDLEARLDPRNERASSGALSALISTRQDLTAFRRLAVAQAEVLGRSAREVPEVVQARFSDVKDNQREAVDMADATRDYVEGVIETYRFLRDQRTDAGIRRLTVLAALLGPPTLITGIYGMNFDNLPGRSDPSGFWIVIGLQVLFVALAALYLRRRGLL